MSEVKWIKITTNIFDDEKIKLIETMPDADMLIVIWFKLLSLSGKCNAGGLVYLTRDIPYNAEMLSTVFRRPANTIRLALTEFQKLGMIEFFDNFIQITNWEKHQDLKLLELAKEKTRLRVQEHRKNQKLLCNVTVTECNGTDKIRLDKIRIDKNKEKKSFAPPSLEEISQYLSDNNIKSFTAGNFFNFYESKGWMIGKNKMKDWKAAIRTWQAKDKNNTSVPMTDDEIKKRYKLGEYAV